MKKSLSFLLIVFFISISSVLTINRFKTYFTERQSNDLVDRVRERELPKADEPDEFALFERGIRTKEGESSPSYGVNYVFKELKKAKRSQTAFYSKAKLEEDITWTERGPANVPGRTRALVVLPEDSEHNTWIAGSVGGGIWKTTDGGDNWIEKTQDLPNIAISTIAISESNPSILYAGTGEGFFNADGIGGNGIFKSLDGGETWSQLASTADDFDFQNINRIIVDPEDENVLLACTANSADYESSIYKSTDGGVSWTNTYSILTARGIQQLIATPGDFDVLYAASNSVGVLKSIDGGDTWQMSNTGMSPEGRVEIAVSPVNTNRIFASVEGSSTGSGSDLYISDDAGASWSLVDVSFAGSAFDYLGGQGWYDNTILCSPYDEDVVYMGGVSIVQVTMGTGEGETIDNYNVNENGTEAFMSFVNFGASAFGGALEIGESANETNVELRFGPGKSQKAHRFTVPDGQGSGVPDGDYSYQDYVDVPFEVWDVDNNKQLMVSFRDQQKDGVFNLLEQYTDAGDEANHSREYVYINNVDYDPVNPNASIAVDGGHIFNEMYFFWPVASEGVVWDPDNLPASTLDIVSISVTVKNASTESVVDPYGDLDNKNSEVHPDQHYMLAIKEDEVSETFRILLSGDGGPYVSKISNDPGITEDDWTLVGRTYNTSQFYGADKKPGEEKYIGGMQDNGTWLSPEGADATSLYAFKLGGDGFEVLWNSLDGDLVIGGSQYNNFSRSTNGGSSFSGATNGLTGSAPFISKLANSKAVPDVIYTVSSDGVFKSENFGESWNLTPIEEFWEDSYFTFLDVEVSRANANIVWAGSGISNTKRIHVSTDQGETFTATNNYPDVSMGRSTKLATHPTDPNTAYVLFSFARSPKILKTEDLGQTWTDISGFGINSTSSNGFPDVAVYCLYVRPDDPNILWAGTDIGIVESIDNGVSWHLMDNEMPKVAIWDMKGQDNQVVIATHGRGIWTATLGESQVSFKTSPTITAFGTAPRGTLELAANYIDPFDSTIVLIDGEPFETFYSLTTGEHIFSIKNVPSGAREVRLMSYFGGSPVQSLPTDANKLELANSFVQEYSEHFNSSTGFLLDEMEIKDFVDGIQNKSLQTSHTYITNLGTTAILKQPVIVSASNSTFNYEDIVLVEPGEAGSSFGDDEFNDYVIVEATKDGLNWIPIANGYDASSESKWQSAYDSNTSPSDYSLYVKHSIDLTDNFDVQDTLLFRFRLHSNAETTGWGWSVDNLYIQTEPLGIEKQTDLASYSVYPNPSKGNFKVDYQLVSASATTLEVSDLSGRVVKSYDLGIKQPGTYRFVFENNKLEDGVYVLSLRTNSGTESKRVIVSK